MYLCIGFFPVPEFDDFMVKWKTGLGGTCQVSKKNKKTDIPQKEVYQIH